MLNIFCAKGETVEIDATSRSLEVLKRAVHTMAKEQRLIGGKSKLQNIDARMGYRL